MRYVLAGYWILGCLLAGVDYQTYLERCPHSKPPAPMEILVDIVTWPMGFSRVTIERQRGLEFDCTAPGGV